LPSSPHHRCRHVSRGVRRLILLHGATIDVSTPRAIVDPSRHPEFNRIVAEAAGGATMPDWSRDEVLRTLERVAAMSEAERRLATVRILPKAPATMWQLDRYANERQSGASGVVAQLRQDLAAATPSARPRWSAAASCAQASCLSRLWRQWAT
jgi:hypothetical protein